MLDAGPPEEGIAADHLARVRSEHPDKRLLSYYQDEARFGQHGTLTRVWAKVGSRPPAIRQTQYDYLYLFTAVCPETGQACGLITPKIDTATMNVFLDQFSRELPGDVPLPTIRTRVARAATYRNWRTRETARRCCVPSG